MWCNSGQPSINIFQMSNSSGSEPPLNLVAIRWPKANLFMSLAQQIKFNINFMPLWVYELIASILYQNKTHDFKCSKMFRDRYSHSQSKQGNIQDGSSWKQWVLFGPHSLEIQKAFNTDVAFEVETSSADILDLNAFWQSRVSNRAPGIRPKEKKLIPGIPG